MLDHLDQIGFVFSQFRNKAGLTQANLAEKSGVNRSVVAHLEQGRRTPPREVFQKLAHHLGIPDGIWNHFAGDESSKRHEFEAALGELVGKTVTLKMIHLEQVSAAERSIDDLFSGSLTLSQAYDSLNSLLIYYGLPLMQKDFFQEYFTTGAFQSIDAFESSIRDYQKDAIRLFSTFGEAYKQFNSSLPVEQILEQLQPRDISKYFERTVWDHINTTTTGHDIIKKIDDSRLPYLGYISAAKYREKHHKREQLASYLKELAAKVREKGSGAVEELSNSRRLRIDSLMRELDSPLQHTPISPLFAPNPDELDEEAKRMLKEEKDLDEMAATQSQALRNLSNYVSADFMDVYVATSMRTDSDFISVNHFVTALFSNDLIAPLRLRYFNPTQSWIENRVAKGLVEALMLKRAGYTIYMAQKSDTFGKDSEASVALGQGKPVIVYVPKLALSDSALDSEDLMNEDESRLREILKLQGDVDQEEIDGLDHDGLFTEVLSKRFDNLNNKQLLEVIRVSWADFGLLDESERIKGDKEAERRENYSKFIRKVASDSSYSELIPEQIRSDLLPILSALTTNFEKRARVFREVHPLALQVILSTGVLNGILVVRSIKSCARVLRALIENKLDLELNVETDNYRLVEKLTGSTVRVISRNNLLVNAFDTYYERA